MSAGMFPLPCPQGRVWTSVAQASTGRLTSSARWNQPAVPNVGASPDFPRQHVFKTYTFVDAVPDVSDKPLGYTRRGNLGGHWVTVFPMVLRVDMLNAFTSWMPLDAPWSQTLSSSSEADEWEEDGDDVGEIPSESSVVGM